jgi:tripeptide aminopeptidase
MHAVHSQREWISLQDMARSVDVLLRLAQLWEERSP